MNFDAAFKIGSIVAWVLAVIVYYFSGQADSAANIAKLSERLSITETHMEQERIGYQALQSSLGVRLERIEKKVDCLIDKRLCN